MPKYSPQGDEMDSSYEAPVTGPGGEAEATPEAKPSVDEENKMDDTALVPVKVLSPEGEPLNEGDEIVVQVVSVHGEDAIVKYAPKKSETEEPSKEEGETTTPEEDFAAMDKEGEY